MVGLIIPSNLKFAPYAQYFMKCLDNQKIQYEIISWNKTGIQEVQSTYTYHFLVHDSERKKVLRGYFAFSWFIKRIVRKRNYSSLIVFTVAAGFFLGNWLITKYKGKFWFDIRDTSPIINKMKGFFSKICSSAYAISVSSPEFSSWIPVPTIMCHNAELGSIINHLDDEIPELSPHNNIIFAGMLNEWEINMELVKILENSEQYNLGFIGTESKGKLNLKKYVCSHNITNVFFKGIYNKENITEIYRNEASFVNIIRCESTVNSQAIPNKLYDAVIAGRPVITLYHNKAIVKYIEKYDLGVVLNELSKKEIDSKLSSFRIHDMVSGQYASGRIRFLKDVINEVEIFYGRLQEFTQNC